MCEPPHGQVKMLPLDDPKWKELSGGYRMPCDVPSMLRKLEAGEDAWHDLWEELHHQGDVGEASYAAVPHLARIAERTSRRDWNFYSLVSVIEIERHRRTNPPLPTWLEQNYKSAWSVVVRLAIQDVVHVEDALMLRSILGAIALARKSVKLGIFLAFSDESEIHQIVEDRYGWSTLYRDL